MMFLLFTLLYLIIQLKINLLILLKVPSREKALITLHVMTEMHFLLQKKLHGRVLQQTPFLVVNPITVGNFAFLFNCTPVGRTSDSMMVPT